MSKRVQESIDNGEISNEEPVSKKSKFDVEEDVDFIIDKNDDDDDDVIELEEGEIKESESTNSKSKWADSLMKSLLNENKPETKSAERSFKPRCFNCDGMHLIRNCPEPRDISRMKKAKLEFQKNKNSTPSRYHVDKQDSNAKYKPGKLSTSLREALNLGPDDIPEWVYRMRRMGFFNGYPPGYLKKALKKSDETLLKFHSSSIEIEAKKTNEDSTPIPPPTVDTDKIVFYMGFNKTYQALRDLERFNVPPFNLYCEMLQKEVDRQHEKEEKFRRREERKKENERMSSDAPNVVEAVENVEGNEQAEVVIDGKEENEEEKDDKIAETSLLGESISMHVGTPVISTRENGVYKRNELPDLEKFSVGIVPFEAKEEIIGEKGAFKRIMNKIRNNSE